MQDSEPNSQRDVAYSSGDVATVCVAGVAALIGMAYLVRSFAGLPGVVIPLAVLWVAAGVICIRGTGGKRAAAQLSVVPKEYKTWLISAVVFGLLMPAVFPDGAYETSPWLMWFNATVLVCGVLGVWATRFFGVCVQRLVQRRANHKKRD